MLKNLNIKNFALIEDIDIKFKQGLTVLTGETGTGKSIILEALSLIFAKRSDQDMIRHGEDKAIVSATFTLPKSLSDYYELGEEINIKREVSVTGRHRITLDNKQISLSFLNELTNKIGSIHSQDETMSLMDQDSYLNFIDDSSKSNVNKLLNDYLIKRSEYLSELKKLEQLKNKKEESLEQKEFLTYQLEELSSYNLIKDEKENLVNKINTLKNFDKISNTLNESLHSFDQMKYDSLYDLGNKIGSLSDYDADFKLESEKILDAYYVLGEVKNLISSKLYSLDFNEQEFNMFQERDYELQKLEDKYNKTINELIEYEIEIHDKIMMADNYDEFIISYEKKIALLKEETYNKAKLLSNYRKKISKKFEKDVINELKDLDLENTQFIVDFKEADSFLETGIDVIDFLISLNEGEPIKPLSKVASGGERARFMFAIKSIYALQNELSILVLDEIDIGISGKTAAKMANKMKKISEELQLIVITHLPQVAAKANYHYGISKQMIDTRMVTNINLLNMDDRITNIAMMLSGETLSHFAIEQAKILLEK